MIGHLYPPLLSAQDLAPSATPASRTLTISVGANPESPRLWLFRQPYDFTRRDELDFAFSYVFPDDDEVTDVQLSADPGLEIVDQARRGNVQRVWVQLAAGAQPADYDELRLTAAMTSNTTPPRRLVRSIRLRVVPT